MVLCDQNFIPSKLLPARLKCYWLHLMFVTSGENLEIFTPFSRHGVDVELVEFWWHLLVQVRIALDWKATMVFQWKGVLSMGHATPLCTPCLLFLPFYISVTSPVFVRSHLSGERGPQNMFTVPMTSNLLQVSQCQYQCFLPFPRRDISSLPGCCCRSFSLSMPLQR